MSRMPLGLLFDVLAGLVVAGALAALVVAASPARPGNQAWLWGLALVAIVAVGAARRRLISGGRGRSPLGWARRILSRPGRDR
jgi:hypothetical protein